MKSLFFKFSHAAVALSLILSSISATAQTKTDVGTWTDIMAIKSFGKPYAMARLEHRSYKKISATECWFAMAGGGYRFTNWLSSDLSYEFWKLPVAGNATVHKAVLSATASLNREGLGVSLKEKYEFAVNPATKAITNTMRSRLRAQYKFQHSIFVPYLIYELFNGFDGNGWIRSLHYIGTDINISAHHALDIYYMYHLYDTEPGTASCNIIGVGYNLKF